MRAAKVIMISIPAALLDKNQRLARQEDRSRGELIREALRQYLASRRWQRLRRWGAETADRLRLESAGDLERLLDKVGAGHRRAAR